MSEYDDILARVRAGEDAAAPADNEYDNLLAQVRGQDKSVMQANLNTASFGQPASEAQKQQIARQLKDTLGEDWAPKAIDPEEAQRRLKVAEYDHVLQSSPKLAQKYLDTGYAERTFDDIHPLAGVEKAASAFGDFVGDRWSALKSSAYSASAGGMGLVRPFTDTAAVLIPSNVTENAADWVANYQAGTTKIADSMLQDKGDFLWNSFDQGLQSLGMNLAMMPAAILTGNPLMTLLPMSAVTGGTEYGKARDAGITIPQAMTYATSQAAIEYATEMLPVTKFIGDLKTGAPFHKMLMNQVAKEVPGEQVATLLQDLNEWAVINQDKPFSAYLAERPSAAAQTLIATVVGVGGQVSTVKGAEMFVDALSGRQNSFADQMMLKAQDAQKSLTVEQTLTGLIDAATQTASISRDPGAVQELIAAATEDGASEIYINARQFATVFNQSAVEVAQRLGIEVGTLDAALASNTDLVVPLDTLATNVALDQALRPLIEHARVDPADMSPVDARLWQSQQGEAFKAEAEQVLVQRQADAVYQADVAQVHASLKTQLAQANRFAPRVNDQYASMVRDFYVTMAERSGMKVSEFAAKYPLKVVAEGTGQLNQNTDQINTPEFKNWFGESKALDVDGKPTPLYHSTDKTFTKVNMKKGAQGVFWMTSDKSAAENGEVGAAGRGKIMDLYAKIERPAGWAEYDKYGIDELIGRGYDGIILPEKDGTFTAVVFEPTQVKSASRNRGTFDPNDPNILHQSVSTRVPSEKGGRGSKSGESAVPPAPTFQQSQNGSVTLRALADEGNSDAIVAQALVNRSSSTDSEQLRNVIISISLSPESNGIVGIPSFSAMLAEMRAAVLDDPKILDAIVGSVPVDVMDNLSLTQEAAKVLLHDEAMNENSSAFNADLVVSRAVGDATDTVRLLVREAALSAAKVLRVTLGPGIESAKRTSAILANQIDSLNQGESPSPRASFNPSTLTIILNGGADLSSFLHESGHFFLEVMADLASQPNAPASVRDDFWKLLNWFGIRGSGKFADRGSVKSVPDRLEFYAKQLGDLAIGESSISQRDGGIRIESVDSVFGDVVSALNNPEIFNSVVRSLSVDVMNLFALEQLSPEMVLHDPAMLKHVFTVETPNGISIPIDRSSALISLLVETAGWTTKVSGRFFDVSRGSSESNSATETGDVWHGESPSAIEIWYSLTFEEKRYYHEMFARGFEQYLFEGKAPSVEAQGMFAKFRAWLTNVYQSLKDLNVTLTDEVRGVMDRMVASEQAIQTAEAVRNFAPIFQTAEQADMTAEEWAQYQDEGAGATTSAVDELQARSIRDMRWLANAKAKKLKELQATAKVMRDQITMDVRNEVMSQQVYRAWAFLTGRPENKAAKVKEAKADPKKVDPLADDLLVAIAKLGGMDIDQAVGEWGMDPADARAKADNTGGKRLVVRKEGMPLDSMGEALASYGYVEVDANGKHDMADFEEKFFDAIKGREIMSDWAENAIPTEDPDRFINLDNTPVGKLDTAIVKAYGDQAANMMAARRMVAKDGMHPDVVANLFGYSSGGELVSKLNAAEDPKTVIEGMVDQRMLEEYGDLATPKDMELAAERAIHNDVRARMLTRELNALRKATGKAPVMLKAARLHADTWLSRQKVRDAIKHGQHVAAEGRSAKAAEAALKTGDTEAAATHKRDQVLNNQLARGALKAADEVSTAVKFLKKFDKSGTRKAIDNSYLDQIDQLLERFDLRQVSQKALDKRASLAKWLADQEALGLDPVIDQRLVEDAQRQHYSTLTIEEFRGLVDTVKSIEHMGRLKSRLLTAKDKRDFAAVAEILKTSIIDNANRDITSINRITPLEKGAGLLKNFAAMHRKFASIIREIDGGKDGGPMWEYLVRTMNEAGDDEVQMRADMAQHFHQLYLGLNGIPLGEKIYIPELGISLRREEMLAVALNSGNKGNVQRLLDGGINDNLRAIQERHLMAVLNRLSDNEWTFVEGVWQMIEANRPAIAAQEKALTGVEPTWIEPDPFTLNSGRVIRGGYYPAKYNASMNTRSNELEAVTDLRQQMMGAAGRSSTRNSYTKERAEAVAGRPLRLDLGVISQHIGEVTHRLAWQEWLIDARRILQHPGIDRALRDHYGPEILAVMKRQLVDIAAGDSGPNDALDKVMNHLRNGTTIAGMGWNIMTSLMQPIGITQSIERVGAGWIAKGLGQFIAHPFKTAADVHTRSSMMANRANTLNREINDILNTIHKERMSKVEATYFYLIQKFQQMVDMPTWLGAYEKAVADGNDDAKGIGLADQAVIDSQGGGQLKDLSWIQRGGAGQKLFTNFYSFFNTTYNRAVEDYRVTDFTNPMMVGRLAANYLLLFTVPAIWGWALKEALRGNDDDDDAEEILKQLAAEQINYLLGTMVLVREIGAAVSGFVGYQGPAGTRFFAELAKSYKQIEQGDVDMALVKAVANTVGIATHLPSGQVTRSVEGLVEFMDNNAGPQAILVGPPLQK